MREGWKSMRLTNFVWFQRGFDLPRTNFVDGNVPVYGSTSVLGYHNVSKVKAPGIITGRSGTLGKFQFANEDFWPHNTSLWVKDFKDNNEKFAYYLLQTLDFTLFNSGGAVPTLNRNLLSAYIVNVPPLETQRKIANILSGYDDLIENNLKRIKILEEMAQQTYEEWFVRMRFPGASASLSHRKNSAPLSHRKNSAAERTETAVLPAAERSRSLPEGWEKVKLGEWIKTSSGGTPSKKKEVEFYENGTIPWVRTGELKNFILIDSELKITTSGLKNSSAKLFPKGTVLLAMYGNTIGEVTYCNFSTSTNQACCGFLVKSENESYFIHQYLLKNKEQVLSFRMGAAQENISQTIIQNMELIKPNEILLTEFGQITKRFYDSIINLLNQNQRLREARDILLPRLMMGIVEV